MTMMKDQNEEGMLSSVTLTIDQSVEIRCHVCHDAVFMLAPVSNREKGANVQISRTSPVYLFMGACLPGGSMVRVVFTNFIGKRSVTMGKFLAWVGVYAVIFLGCGPPVWGEAPGRIVSLAPSLTREIYDLKEQDRLVGVTSFCPAEARKEREVVGTLTLLNIEKICALKPDLVLDSMDSNRETAVEKLKSLGLRVEVFQGCESFACMSASLSGWGLCSAGNTRRRMVETSAGR